jgi:hypothetical protein
MKKITIFILLFFVLILTGCTATFNPLTDEELLIYENEDKTVRLEIPYYVSFGTGRLYIVLDSVVIDYVIDYRVSEDKMIVYVNQPEPRQNEYILYVSFEQISYFKYNYDKMFLTEFMKPTDSFVDELLSGFDETLIRVYDEDVHPLNYLYNTWQSEDDDIYLINNSLNDYYYHRVHGEFNQESVTMTFEDGQFIMTGNIDSLVKLSGAYDFDDLNIVLHPLSIYEDYAIEIVLTFESDNNA